MTTEENRALYRRWFDDVVNLGKLELADDLLADGYVMHMPGAPGPLDSEGHKQMLRAFLTGFADWHESVDAIVAEGDRVVVWVTGTGTHTGDFQGIPPTNRSVTVTGVGMGRIEGGRIAEAWASYDALGLLQQLGAFPS